MELIDYLEKLAAGLRQRNIPYALCGGLAMAVHAFPRATLDIDILVEEAESMTVSMSPKAITSRLRRASQLRRLCVSLKRAERSPPHEDEPQKSNPQAQHASDPAENASAKQAREPPEQ